MLNLEIIHLFSFSHKYKHTFKIFSIINTISNTIMIESSTQDMAASLFLFSGSYTSFSFLEVILHDYLAHSVYILLHYAMNLKRREKAMD